MLEVGFIVAIILVGFLGVIRVYEWWENQKEGESIMNMKETKETKGTRELFASIS